MQNYKEINWHQLVADEVYAYYDELQENEKFSFFKWLYLNYPETDIDFLDIFEDLRCEMAYETNIVESEEFVEWYSEKFPIEYAERYEFIERDLCDYYLKNNDLDKLRERIAIIEKNPLSGIDTITIRLYYQLIYHGLYQDAVDYAKNISDIIYKSDKIRGRPEAPLMTGIYVDSLQKSYEKYKKTGIANFEDVYKLAEELEFIEHKEVFRIETKALLNPLNTAEILSDFPINLGNRIIELNVHFLKYMYEKYNIPFMLSETFWSVLSSKKLFDKSLESEEHFYFDVITIEKYLENKFDYSLGSNNIEFFGKVWALHYIYEFLEVNNFISADAAKRMKENIQYHRNELINYMNTELWTVNFVFNWPENHLWLDLKPIFEITYNKEYVEVKEIIHQLNEKYPMPKRIEDEIAEAKAKHEKEKYGYNTISSNESPYIKKGPDIGRNDPCPCGSGKTCKKCCLK